MSKNHHKTLDLDEVRKFIADSSPESKVYIGCDSERYKKNGQWFAEYATVIVVHKDGKHGCKIFGELTTERDFDQKKGSPTMRLMNEVYKTADMFLALSEVLVDKEVELHLDINPNEKYASNPVVQQAVGYIKGVCDITPKIKPEAFCASYAADRYSELKETTKHA